MIITYFVDFYLFQPSVGKGMNPYKDFRIPGIDSPSGKLCRIAFPKEPCGDDGGENCFFHCRFPFSTSILRTSSLIGNKDRVIW
jgi:hypothetical protein